MSIWRRKRRYEENRRFSERADDALLAIGIVQNAADGVEPSRSDDEITEMLREGIELLEDVKEALNTPENADDYTYALAQELCNEWKQVPEDVSDRLSEDIKTVRAIEQNMTVVPGTEALKETLSDIEEITERISESEARRMRNNLVD